jgi:hypothetical protein
MSLIATGVTREEIAQRRGTTIGTVRSLLHTAYRRLGARDSAEAIGALYSAGWLDPVETEWGDDRATPAQGLYLRSFDRLLTLRHTDTAALYIAGTKEMTHHLRGIYYEIERLPPWEVLGAPRTPVLLSRARSHQPAPGADGGDHVVERR